MFPAAVHTVRHSASAAASAASLRRTTSSCAETASPPPCAASGGGAGRGFDGVVTGATVSGAAWIAAGSSITDVGCCAARASGDRSVARASPVVEGAAPDEVAYAGAAP